jgi:hypothetical protein
VVSGQGCKRAFRWGGGEGETHHEGENALCKMHHGRVEIGALVEGGRNHGGRKGRGRLGNMSAFGVETGWGNVDSSPKLQLRELQQHATSDKRATHPCVPRQPHLHRSNRENIKLKKNSNMPTEKSGVHCVGASRQWVGCREAGVGDGTKR